MPTRDSAPIGSPCWADLWTSDVDGSRKFYADLFGWEAQEPSPEFGGYFMFTRDGVPTAGGMGDMGDMPADNTWKIYLNTDDIATTIEAAEASGAQIAAPATPAAGRCSAIRPAPTGAPGSLGPFRGSRSSTSTERRAGSSCSPGITPPPSPFTARCSTGTPTSSVTAMSSGTRPCATPEARASWRGSGTQPRSSPRAYLPTGRSTGRSTTPTSPSPRSRHSGDRS